MVTIQHQDVAVSGTLAPSLDWCVSGNRVQSRIALVSIQDGANLYFCLATTDDTIGYPKRSTVIIGAKVRVQPGRSNAADDRIGIGVDRSSIDALVPRIIGRKQPCAVQTGVRAQIRHSIIGGLSRGDETQAPDHGEHETPAYASAIVLSCPHEGRCL